MGSAVDHPDEAPLRRVRVDGFWMDAASVTNREFGEFVKATGHVTVAEQPLDPRDHPRAERELLLPGSLVFRQTDVPVDLQNPHLWWAYVPGASWRHPCGPGSAAAIHDDHPVVHVAYEDAVAYARWAGKELPTEAQWEYAARGGLDRATYVWGDDFEPNGHFMANTWQGDFPSSNLCLDGYERTSPVGAFPANGFGLLDMAGNVWEWTQDWYADASSIPASCCLAVNPRGPSQEASFDPASGHVRIPRKVLKGGSFLCAPSYCNRYRPSARQAQTIDTSACHIGFRCIKCSQDVSYPPDTYPESA